MSRARYDSKAVQDALAALVAENPDRVDRRAGDDLAPKYVEHGQPSCLVAALLHRMGISVGLLKQLDREESGPGGIVLWATEHAIRRRFTPAAWELLAALQACNDQGRTWKAASEDVFHPERWLGRRWNPWNEGRPWMKELNQ